MIKFYFPQDTDRFKQYYEQEALKKHLFVLAEKDDETMAVCEFFYSGKHCQILSIKGLNALTSLIILDGLFRTVMFHLMEMECKSVAVFEVPELMNDYFERLGFTKEEFGWFHPDFEKALFSGCPSCSGGEK